MLFGEFSVIRCFLSPAIYNLCVVVVFQRESKRERNCRRVSLLYLARILILRGSRQNTQSLVFCRILFFYHSLNSPFSVASSVLWSGVFVISSIYISSAIEKKVHRTDLSLYGDTKNKILNMAGENRGPQVAGVAGFFVSLSTIFVFLRVYCRVVVVKAFGADDYLAVIAWVSLRVKITALSHFADYDS